MYKLYCIVSAATDWYYIGMTKQTLYKRMEQHKNSARSGKASLLYSVMRKYGIEKFDIEQLAQFDDKMACMEAEMDAIFTARLLNHRLINLADGGEGGFCVNDEAKWKENLSKSRLGKKPALGMKHTDKNKELFSKVSRAYWDSVDTYNAKEVCSVPFKEARDKYGISRTHYYRLKRSLNSEQG